MSETSREEMLFNIFRILDFQKATAMGQMLGTIHTRHLDLHPNNPPTFDSTVGFKTKRKVREMLVTNEELVSARIPPKFRDYCAHYLLDYQVCRHREMPLLFKCHHEKHAYLNCEHDDYVIRMKEFERERRLRERELRIKAAKEAKHKPPPENKMEEKGKE